MCRGVREYRLGPTKRSQTGRCRLRHVRPCAVRLGQIVDSDQHLQVAFAMQSADQFAVHWHDVVDVMRHASQCRHFLRCTVDRAHFVDVGPAGCCLGHDPLAPGLLFQFHFERRAIIAPARGRYRLNTDATFPARIARSADLGCLLRLVFPAGELALGRTVDAAVGFGAMLEDLVAALATVQRDLWPTHGGCAELVAAFCRAGLDMDMAGWAAKRLAADDAGPSHRLFVAVVPAALAAVQTGAGIHLILYCREGGATGFTNALDLLPPVRGAQYVSTRGSTSLPLLGGAVHGKPRMADYASFLDRIALYPCGGNQLATAGSAAAPDRG